MNRRTFISLAFYYPLWGRIRVKGEYPKEGNGRGRVRPKERLIVDDAHMQVEFAWEQLNRI